MALFYLLSVYYPCEHPDRKNEGDESTKDIPHWMVFGFSPHFHLLFLQSARLNFYSRAAWDGRTWHVTT